MRNIENARVLSRMDGGILDREAIILHRHFVPSKWDQFSLMLLMEVIEAGPFPEKKTKNNRKTEKNNVHS